MTFCCWAEKMPLLAIGSGMQLLNVSQGGNLMLHNIGVVTGLYDADPAQAVTAWTALQSVEVGITSGNELVGSLWVLLLSVAALRTGQWSRALSIFGVVLGLAGMLTIAPALSDSLVMVFGPGMVVWSIWVGIVLLRRKPADFAVLTGEDALFFTMRANGAEGGILAASHLMTEGFAEVGEHPRRVVGDDDQVLAHGRPPHGDRVSDRDPRPGSG